MVDYLRVCAGDLAADPVVPGVSGKLGVVMTFGRDAATGRLPLARLFAWGEGGYAWRMGARVRAGAGEGSDEEPRCRTPPRGWAISTCRAGAGRRGSACDSSRRALTAPGDHSRCAGGELAGAGVRLSS